MTAFPTIQQVEAAVPAGRLPYLRAQEALGLRSYRVTGTSDDKFAVRDDYQPRQIASAIQGFVDSPDLDPPLPSDLSVLLSQMVEAFDEPHLKGVSDERVLRGSSNLSAAVTALRACVDHGLQANRDIHHLLDPHPGGING